MTTRSVTSSDRSECADSPLKRLPPKSHVISRAPTAWQLQALRRRSNRESFKRFPSPLAYIHLKP